MESLKKKIVKYNNTKDYFSWETKKINVNLTRIVKNAGKVLKQNSCVRCHFVKFDIYFLGLL